MMRWRCLKQGWGFTFLFLAAGQLLALLIWHPTPFAAETPADSHTLALLDLARTSHRAWEFPSEAEEKAKAASLRESSAGETLLEEASLLLRLRTIEDALGSAGIPVQLSEVCRRWSAGLQGRPPAARPVAAKEYLRGILSLSHSLGPEGEGPVLNAIELEDKQAGAYPLLKVVLAGEPSRLGKQLHQVLYEHPLWEISKLELSAMKDCSDWQLRCAFQFTPGE
jgi:hypothetical protein